MAEVEGLTKERMLEIEGASIVSGYVADDGSLVLFTRSGNTIIAGRVTGEAGNDGDQGDPGPPTYTWLRYADTPTSGMSEDPEGKSYIGFAYNKTTPFASEVYSDYTWSLIRGATGASVVNAHFYYKQLPSDSEAPDVPTTSVPDETWSEDEPDYISGTDLWAVFRVLYSDDTFAYSLVSKSSIYKAASEAVDAANGKNKITYASTDPDVDGTAVGDQWFKYSDSVVIGMWSWDGSEWNSRDIDGLAIANIDAGKITTGFLSAERIEAESITAEKLDAEEIWTARAWIDVLEAGRITAVMLSSDVGAQIALDDNVTIKFLDTERVNTSTALSGITEDIGDLNSDIAAVNGSVAIAQSAATLAQDSANAAQTAATNAQNDLNSLGQFYRFTSVEAIIGKIGDPTEFRIKNNEAAFYQSGIKVTWWDSGQFFVTSMIVQDAKIGNHKIEAYGTERTIFRKV